MPGSTSTVGSAPKVGFSTGWRCTFTADPPGGLAPASDTLSVSSEDFEGAVTVDWSGNFSAPSFELRVWALSDEDFQRVVGTPDGDAALAYVQLELGWADLGGSVGQMLSAVVGLDQLGELPVVIEGRILEVDRVTGAFQYVSVFRGVDWRFHKLGCSRIDSPRRVEKGKTIGQAVEFVLGGVAPVAGKRGDLWDLPLPADLAFTEKESRADGLEELAKKAHAGTSSQRVPMYLAPDGLVFGHRDEARDEGTHRPTADTGLVQLAPTGDPPTPPCDDEPGSLLPASKEAFKLVMMGRPDIWIGDHLELDPMGPDLTTSGPSTVGGLLESLVMPAPPPAPGSLKPFRVTSLKHTLSKEKGFVTELRVDAVTASETGTEEDSERAKKEVKEAKRLASTIDRRIALAVGSRQPFSVAEVNRQLTDGTDPDGRQRLDVQEGLEPGHAGNRAVRSTRIDDATPLTAKPYLTPFAWGKAGLVVPHYPGARVMTLNFEGSAQEAVVAGCVWREGNEPASQPGDYWLCLPVDPSPDVETDDSRSVEFPEGQPGSHDLTDVHGARVIQVAGLKISVGDSLLEPVGERPDPPSEPEVLIQHERASIHIDANGNITITSEGDLTLTAANTLTLEANKIEAVVATHMEVHR